MTISSTRSQHRKVHPAATRRAKYRVQRRREMTIAVHCVRTAGVAGAFLGLIVAHAARLWLQYRPSQVPAARRTIALTLQERVAVELRTLAAAVAAVVAVAGRRVGRNASAVREISHRSRVHVAACPGRGPNRGLCWPESRPALIGFPP